MFNLAADGGTAPPGSQTPGLQTAGSPTSGARLELALAAIEGRLAALDEALRTRDMAGIDLHASELQRRLANAVDPFTRAARSAHTRPLTSPLPRLASYLSRIHKPPFYEAAGFIEARCSDGSINEEQEPAPTCIWTGELPAR